MSHELKPGWITVPISELAETRSGGTPSTAKREYWDNGDVPWINSGALKDCVISKPSTYITKLGSENSAAKLFPKNTVVVALTGATTGRVGIIDFACSANQSVTGMFPSEAFLPSYLFNFLRSARPAVLELAIGSAQPHINKRIVDDFEVPLAPLAEQRRIVAKLGTLLGKVDASQQRLAKIPVLLKRFRQSVLAAACSGRLTADWRENNPNAEPYPIDSLDSEQESPTNWRATRLGNLTTLVTSGSRGWAKYYSESGSIFIRAQNINSDLLNLDDIAFVRPPASAEGLRTRVRRHDILVTITGANVTKSALVEKPIENAYVSQHVALVRLKDSRLSKFAFQSVIDPAHGRKQLLAAAYGQGKPGLNLNNIRDVEIALPPLAEQQEIVRRVDELFALADQIEARYTRAVAHVEKLTQSILAKAFSGELVPQDPNDEPASVLLERIRNQRNGEQHKHRHGKARNVVITRLEL
jgi:type I restriction enzyme, S subunit